MGLASLTLRAKKKLSGLSRKNPIFEKNRISKGVKETCQV